MAHVKLLSRTLRSRHGRRTIEMEATDVEELLGRLRIEPDPDLRVLVNGRAIALLEGVATPLETEDAVTIYSVGIRGWPGG